jgi:hypothetical protein
MPSFPICSTTLKSHYHNSDLSLWSGCTQILKTETPFLFHVRVKMAVNLISKIFHTSPVAHIREKYTAAIL